MSAFSNHRLSACNSVRCILGGRGTDRTSRILLLLILTGSILPLFVSVGWAPLSWSCENPADPNTCKIQTNFTLNFSPSGAEGPDGNIWLVWQSHPPATIQNPLPGPHISLKKYSPQTSTWTRDSNATPTCNDLRFCGDTGPDIIRLANNTIMMVWSRKVSDNNLGDIYYRLNFGGVWSSEVRLTSGPESDAAPSILQDRKGTLWIVWQRNNATESVVYDSNSNSIFDSGETVIVQPSPTVGTLLRDDPKIKYDDKNNPNVWNSGEAVVYDSNSNNATDIGEFVISGAVPTAGTPLKDDPKLLYVDQNKDNVRDVSAIELFYKFFNGSIWSQDFQLTQYQVRPNGLLASDQLPSIMEAHDGRIWVVWSSSRNSQLDIFYKTLDGTGWSPNSQIFNDTDGYNDRNPDILQDNNGTIRLFWARDIPTATVCNPCGEIFSKSSTDNGVTWSGMEQLITDGSSVGVSDGDPAIVFSDHRIRVFWRQFSTLETYDIVYRKSEPIFAHDVAITSVSSPTMATWNTTFQITIAVVNKGDFSETVSVSLKLGTLSVGTKTVSLGVKNPATPGVETGTVVFPVKYNNTTMLPPGRYSVTASATIAQEPQGNLPDNVVGAGLLSLFAPGDIDLDGIVGLVDAIQLAESFGSRPGLPSWRPAADLDGNGIVDMSDAVMLAKWVDTKI